MNILFYNVENLFDTLDDPFTNDNAFLPNSKLKWNEKRIQAAKTLKYHIEEVIKSDKNAKILVMGDFNADPESPPLRSILDIDRSNSGLLHNLSWEAYKTEQGSLNYRGKWLLFDQFLASPALLNHNDGFRVISDSFRVFKRDWMLFYNQKYHDFRPNKTYGGRKYHGGFSDHLPVCISASLDNN